MKTDERAHPARPQTPAAGQPGPVRKPERPRRLVAALLFGFMALAWGSTWLFIKTGLKYYPPFFSIAARFVVAGPFFLLVMKIRRESIPWQWRHQPFFLTLGLLSFIISYGVVYWASQFITSGLASVLFASMPLLSNVVAYFWIREQLGAPRIAGLLLGLAGIVIINSSDLAQMHPRAPLAAAVMLISPLVIAFTTVMAKRKSKVYTPAAMAAVPMLYGAAGHTILWFLLERHEPLVWSWAGAGIIAYLTVFGTIVTFGGYYWLLQYYEVGRLNLLAYLTPIVALTMGFFVGEALSTRIVLGAAIVLVGVAVANRRGARAPAPGEPPPPTTSRVS